VQYFGTYADEYLFFYYYKGSTDGTVRVWEVATSRCIRVWDIGVAIRQVAWNPLPQLPILAVSV